MIVKTGSLDRAAYFVYWGAKILNTLGSIADYEITLEVTEKILQKEKQKAKVWYKAFMYYRQQVKERLRSDRGLPRRYSINKGFKFIEVANVK